MNKDELKRYNNLYTPQERKILIAQTIAGFRKVNKLQQKEVAELIGIKPQTYGAYESGRNEIPIELLVRLSYLYDVPVDILIQRDNLAKTQKTALEQMDYLDEQLQTIKEEFLKGDNEQFSMLISSLEKMTETMREASKVLPPDKKE